MSIEFMKKIICCENCVRPLCDSQKSEIRLKICKSTPKSILPPQTSSYFSRNANNKKTEQFYKTQFTSNTTKITNNQQTDCKSTESSPLFIKLIPKNLPDNSAYYEDSIDQNQQQISEKLNKNVVFIDPRKIPSKIPKIKSLRRNSNPSQFHTYDQKPKTQNKICTDVVSFSVGVNSPIKVMEKYAPVNVEKINKSIQKSHRKSYSILPKQVALTRQIPSIISPVSNTKSVMAPSSKSKFKFVPSFIRPDRVLRQKLDADLATALAISRGKFENSESVLSTCIGSYRNSIKMESIISNSSNKH